MKKKPQFFAICCLFIFSAIISSNLLAQTPLNKDSMFVAAQEIIKGTTYCALVTIDSTGQPNVRTMNPFPANPELITWFATSRYSQKVREIKKNPNVCVYYADHLSAKGYVTINGTAEVIDDKDLLMKMKRVYWKGIKNWQELFVLIKIVPKSVEVVNYKHGMNGDPKTFKAPSIILN